jgi:hypothetical protein
MEVVTRRIGRPSQNKNGWGQKALISVRCSEEWKVWFKGLVEAHGKSGSVTVEDALVALATRIGYDEPIPDRL